MKTPLSTAGAPAPFGPYSQGLIAGPLILVSGQGPVDPESREIAVEGIVDQTHKTIDAIEAILAEAGASLADVIKVTAYLVDLDDFDGFDEAFGARFPEPRPVRTTCGARLPEGLVEIDAIALRPESA